LKHLNRVHPCKPILSDISIADLLLKIPSEAEKKHFCEVCGKGFPFRQSKSRHQKACKGSTDVVPAIPDVAQLTSTVTLLQAKVAELEAKGNAPSTINNTTNNITNNNVQNNINNIILHNFGHESLDHLPSSFLSYCFANCKDGEGLTQLIKDMHFDKECPENHNVRMKSTKRELMEVYNDGKWVVSDQDKVLTDLIQKGYRVLRSHGRKHKDGVMEEEGLEEAEFNEVVDWLEKIYEDKREQKPIKRELLLLFLNNQPVLLERGT